MMIIKSSVFLDENSKSLA